MLNVRLAGDHLYEKLLFTCFADDIFHGVFLCCLFSHVISLVRFGIELGQFLKVLLPTLSKLLWSDFRCS